MDADALSGFYEGRGQAGGCDALRLSRWEKRIYGTRLLTANRNYAPPDVSGPFNLVARADVRLILDELARDRRQSVASDAMLIDVMAQAAATTRSVRKTRTAQSVKLLVDLCV